MLPFIQGQILLSGTSEDKLGCWSLCKSIEDCAWFSFATTLNQTCLLFETCPEINSNPQFVSGQKECDYGELAAFSLKNFRLFLK